MVLWTEVPEGRDLIRTETLCYDLDVSLRTSLCGIISLGVAVLLLHNIIPRSLDLPLVGLTSLTRARLKCDLDLELHGNLSTIDHTNDHIEPRD